MALAETADLDALTRWGRAPAMNPLEATMWRGERHPANSSQGAMIEILDSTPAWDELVDAHRRAFQLLPRFRQRVATPAVPVGAPTWITDEGFDLAYHLRRVRLPAPGSRAQLMELAQALASTPLDRGRPLWTACLVEGLEGGRAAYLLIVHHCLTDGMGLIQLLSRLQRDGPLTGDGAAVVGGGAHTLQRATGVPRIAVKLLGTAGRSLRAGPVPAARFASSLSRVLAPPKATPSPLMSHGRRRAWRFGTMECGLDELKSASRAAGGTLNDAYVAAILGGLRRYHEARGFKSNDIPMSMPVSIRRPGDPPGGNRFAGAFFAAPMSEADPVERMRLLGATVRKIQREPALDFFSVILPVLNLAPSPLLASVFTALQSKADLTVSNIPGVREPVHLVGARVERMFCFGALPGSGMTNVLCSHNGVCCISINCDGEAFTDTEALFDYMRQGLDEVLAVGR